MVCCCFKISDGNKNWGAQQVQQEIHHCMIMDIVLSNHGFQTWQQMLVPMVPFLIAVYCHFTVSTDMNGLGKHCSDVTDRHFLKKGSQT
jgi:hypothetical protein